MDQADIEQFHNNLKAALIAKIPLAAGRDNRLSLTELENLQHRLKVITGDSGRRTDKLSTGIIRDETFPKWYRAAWTVFAQTGSMLPVLEVLSVRPLAIRDVSRALRWTIIYLLIVLTTALVGLLIIYIRVTPAIESFREDLQLPSAIEVTQHFDVQPWLPWIILVLTIGLILSLFWMLVGGIANLTSWLGGRRYVGWMISTTVLRVSQSLVRAGMAVKDAVSIGCDLTGAESKVQEEIQSMIQGADEIKAIGQMADYCKLTANKQLSQLRIATPVVLITIFGGGLALMFCLIVFWPILSLLKDLPTAGV